MAASLDFSGRTVLVTGGSGGIGNGIARAFRDAGADVTITGTRAQSEYQADLSGMAFRQLDVADDTAVKALEADMPALDVLVNNAGTVVYRGREFEPETFRKVLDVNLTSALHLANRFHDKLRYSRGSVVNIASLTSFFGSRGNPAYGASKAAIVQLTKSLAVAWAPDGIRVNAIAPGWVETSMTQRIKENASLDAAILARSPMGRWGTPEDIAGVALFLASDLAGFVTGETIVADGGYSVGV